MISRERIDRALSHEETDKIPIDLGSTGVTGMSASIISKLREYYGLGNEPPVKVIEPYQMLGEVSDDLKAVLGIDCVELPAKRNIFGFENTDWKPWTLFDGTEVLVPGKFNTEKEVDGSIYQYPEGDATVPPSAHMPKDGYYFDAIIRQLPIDDCKLKIEDNLEEFKLISGEDLNYLKEKVRHLYKNTDFAIVANFGVSCFGDIAYVPAPFLKNPKGIRDIQEWYISLSLRKDYIYEIFSRQCDIAIRNLKKIYKVVGNKVSVVFSSGTDFGTQRGLFISKKTYRELFKPFHIKINSWIHTNTKWKTFIHTCGSIEPLIRDFIEAEFDILNPVQISAEGMDPNYLKKEYGKDIVFWGGGVDTQKTLPFGTKEEVRKEVKERIKNFNKGGGFVFNSIHNIQAKTPVENVITMFETAKNIEV